MYRCLELAKLGAGSVAPNPMVGAVLVTDDRIIGEGYHEVYGGPHAEPNCLASVRKEEANLIAQSVMYVSLEPCAHFGKTPPCADLIIKNRIPKVVVGCRDPFKEVRGKGIEKLLSEGIEVDYGVLENDCKELNKRFFTFHTEHRPYIILKWAQTANGFMAQSDPALTLRQPGAKNGVQTSEVEDAEMNQSSTMSGAGRLYITNEFTNRLVHKWRSEEAAILVGTNTVLMDDPQLTTRLCQGKNPTRLVIDMDLKIPPTSKIFNRDAKTIVFNKVKHEEKENVLFYRVTDDVNIVHQVSNALYQLKILSVIVEGGATLLQSFIDEGMWDEARVIGNRQLTIGRGLPAPVLTNCEKTGEENVFSDAIHFYKPA
jgi:diaminohydroxyphosphoribosylaminopyrimidine deaminase / 5-amino-6-(5-phosphoribosylamino)uracil reductase